MPSTSAYASTRPANTTTQVFECDTVTDWLTVRRAINPSDDLLRERTTLACVGRLRAGNRALSLRVVIRPLCVLSRHAGLPHRAAGRSGSRVTPEPVQAACRAYR